jgi:hypothetical protein
LANKLEHSKTVKPTNSERKLKTSSWTKENETTKPIERKRNK